MLTFNVVLGYQGLQFRDFLWFVFLGFFFNPNDQPNIRKCIWRQMKKKGMALSQEKIFIFDLEFNICLTDIFQSNKFYFASP